MALSRIQKEEMIERYQSGMAKASNAFVLDYKGISVPDDTELRAKLREVGASYEVVKNTLAKRAFKGEPLEDLQDHLQGPTAVAYTNGDAVALAKALTDFAKTVPAVEFKAGILDGEAVDVGLIGEIATLPSREVLLAKLLYLMQSPITNFAKVLDAIPRNFVLVLDQIAKKKA